MTSRAPAPPDEPLFTAQASTAWVYYVQETDPNGGIDRRSAFVPRIESGLPLTLSLAESWQIDGVYVFLGQAVLNDGLFLERCRRWLATSAPADTAFAWIANPNADHESWTAQTVRVKRRTANAGMLAVKTRIVLRNYALVFAKGAAVEFDPLLAGFRVGGGGAASSVRFEIDGGTGSFSAGEGGAALALRGRERALWACQVHLPAAGPGAPSALDQLDTCIRYFHPAPVATAPDRVASLRFPVFDSRKRALTLHATLDPNDALGPRSALAFGDEPEPLASYFRTTGGDVVRLRPVGCRLRFGVRTQSTTDPSSGDYYLMPSGPCEVSAAARPIAMPLLCGISAAESIELGEAGVVLSFVHASPGFAPGFASRDVVLTDVPEDAPRLSPLALTSWVSIGRVGARLDYFAQPEKALLYGPPPTSSTPGTAPLLPFFPVRAAELPPLDATTLESSAAAPMVPYAGCDVETSRDAMALEVEVLSQERRDCFVGTPAAPPISRARRERSRGLHATAPDAGVRVMTPGGWIATFADDHSDWHSLELARLGSQVLALEDIKDPLRSALLANQQFVVISDPNSIRDHFARANSLEIDGWRFDLSPARWTEHGTLMILKSCDRPLADLAEDLATWTMPESFNAYPALTQRELLAIIADAKARVRTNADAPEGSTTTYAHFVRTVLDDPRWNGVLFLRAYVPPQSIPDDLESLRPGIDPRLLFAHHLGVSQTHVRSEGAALVQENSSLFGLIRYADTIRPPGTPPASFAFQVLDLEVEFANSAMRNFNSRVVALVQTLFGAPAAGHDPDFGSALVLTGAHQRRGAKVVYVFHNENWNTFDLADAVLRSVTITRLEMASQSVDAAPAGGEPMKATRFNLWGSLVFRQLTGTRPPDAFDLFGFDALGFSGLSLLMTYPAHAPRAATFALDATGVTLDPSSARPRAKSFPRHFPVTARALASSAVTPDPWKLGFMRMQLPSIDTAPLGSNWFGVLLDLNLGTPGALASVVDLTATVGLFWSPDSRNPRVMAGLKLPGSTGGRNELSLMGVLKLSIYSTQLLNADGAFLLKLTGMTLTLMGKSLPPTGDFEFFLFGDPDPRSGSSSLGWYAAYRKPKPPAEEAAAALDSRQFAVRRVLAARQPRAGKPRAPARRTATRAQQGPKRVTRRKRQK